MIHALGFDFYRASQAHARIRKLQLYATLRASDAPIPPAKSLSCHRQRHLEQGDAGTCWVHAPAQHVEIYAKAKGYELFPACRRLIGFEGKALEDHGNMSDGGAPQDAYVAMTVGHVGIANETLWPYTDDYAQLDQLPPLKALADGARHLLAAPLAVADLAEAQQLIALDHPVTVGIPWTEAWDTEGATAFAASNPGHGGHALLIIGYVQAGVWSPQDWYQLDNWHGLLYRPLTTTLAAQVPGYQPIGPDRTSDFWVRGDCLSSLITAPYQLCSATDLSSEASPHFEVGERFLGYLDALFSVFTSLHLWSRK